ncbi:MAG: complex I NDUFA9 subunit family protein [Gemmatimonadota bacterium]
MSQGPPPPLQEPTTSSPGPELATEPAPDPFLTEFPRPQRVIVAGATGFMGRHVVARLAARGHAVRALCRTPDPERVPHVAEWWPADVTAPEEVAGAAAEQDVVLHLVGVREGREVTAFRRVHVDGTRTLVEEAVRAGVRRFIYVSVAGARPDGSVFFRTKWEGEGEVVRSGLEYLIFRPSIVYGPGDKFTSALAILLKRLPVFPVLGVGSMRLQPVAVEDVTDALVQAVERPDMGDAVYELAGPEQLKLTKIVRLVARALGLRRPIVQLPRPLAAPALWAVNRLGLPAPLTPAQLDMLCEASLLTKADNALRTVFRVEPMPFRVAVVDYL